MDALVGAQLWKSKQILALFLLLFGLNSFASGHGPGTILSPKEYALQRLTEAGVSNKLISLIDRVYNPEDLNRIVGSNVLAHIARADYSGHLSDQALKKCLEFIKKYRRRLKKVEASYQVPKEVIAALLWVETKHGTHLGTRKVLSTYFSLLQSNHPEILKQTLAGLSERVPASASEERQKVIDRANAKSNWALRELKSLDEILARGTTDLRELNGSYAGAFGIPQFIPSSYLQWARSKDKDKPANLFDMEDAIQSVGFYLKANGWNSNDPRAQREALFHYNRSVGYVEVILKIAKRLGAGR